MKNIKPISICLFLAALIVMLPICFADEIRTSEGVTLAKNTDSAKDPKNNKVASAQAASVANIFPGLAAWLVALISPFVTYIAIGAALIAAGYVIYRVGYSVWTYYNAYNYNNVDYHAYNEHKTEFQNIWGSKIPSKSDFDKKCKENMNSKSVQRYIQVSDGRSIAYNSATKMLTVGETDGKLVVTCFKKSPEDVAKEVSKGLWKKIN